MNHLQIARTSTYTPHRSARALASLPEPAAETPLRTQALAIGAGDCVDDAVCHYLTRFAIDVKVVHGEAQIRRALAPGRFDLILLDIEASGDMGLQLCLWVRQLVPNIPVIILTPEDDLSARVAGLDLGADDCLAKPFDPRELAARIKAVMRRKAPQPWMGQADRFDKWVFDRMHRQLVMRDGSAVALSAYEARLLSVFIEHPWQLLTRDRLLEYANATMRSVTYRSVDLAVSRLRAKMGDDAHKPTMIRTVRGEGYLLSAGPRL